MTAIKMASSVTKPNSAFNTDIRRQIMGTTKCIQLVARLSGEPEPQIVRIENFFYGNGGLGSIGCNVTEHSGIEVFREVCARIDKRPDVIPSYAQIS